MKKIYLFYLLSFMMAGSNLLGGICDVFCCGCYGQSYEALAQDILRGLPDTFDFDQFKSALAKNVQNLGAMFEVDDQTFDDKAMTVINKLIDFGFIQVSGQEFIACSKGDGRLPEHIKPRNKHFYEILDGKILGFYKLTFNKKN